MAAEPIKQPGLPEDKSFDIVPNGALPEGEALRRQVAGRRTRGAIWRRIFFASLVVGIVALAALIYTIVNDSYGLVAVQSRVPEEELTGSPDVALEDLSQAQLLAIFDEELSNSQRRRFLAGVEASSLEELNEEQLVAGLREVVLREEFVASYTLVESLLRRGAIEAEVAEEFPRAELRWNAWLSWDFITSPMSSNPLYAGVRTALLGSLYMIALTMLVAIPIGVGAAIYLEEYASDNWFNRLIRTNIYNLAGVPSIIYGMLGLAIFVRALEYFTSGAFLGIEGNNGRTLISASLTLALLILPLIIINGQEAIRAVPGSLRQASYGLGATKWQTVWNVVLPNAFGGILTGTILAMSRAIGESAPLIVVGVSTFILTDPSGPFSKFTALPILIFNWTSRPQVEYQYIAAAASVVLLVVLLSLNSLAIYLRNRFRRSA
jgi:phosphate transport system permease protein